MSFNYKFPAVRGVQANTDYYITMVPMNLLSKLFTSADEFVSPEFRAQRRLNEQRIPEIGNYVLRNRESYVFSALSASIDGKFKFVPVADSLGFLEIDMAAKFLINDGQHRRAAIEYAINEDTSIGEETISIVFFRDQGLEKSQQMFTDLNKHAVKTSNSIATLYDYRDQLANTTRKIIDCIPFFKRFVDKERDHIGKHSAHLFNLHHLYRANQRIIKKDKNILPDDVKFLSEFWKMICDNITEWNDLLAKRMYKNEFKEQYVASLAVIILSFGVLGSYFYYNREIKMEQYLPKLKEIDWRRDSDNWKGNIINENDRVLVNQEAINAACKKIKSLIGLG